MLEYIETHIEDRYEMKLLTYKIVTVVLFTVCFVFQILPLLTVPVSKGLILSEFQGFRFGVFGRCYVDNDQNMHICHHDWKADTEATAEYSLKILFPSLYTIALSRLLIVNPIAFAFTCVAWIISWCIVFTKYGNEPRFVLISAVWTMLTFVLSLLSFLVDLLLFVNKLAWPGWLILAATVILAYQCYILWALRRKVSARRYVYCGYAQQLHRMDRESPESTLRSQSSSYNKHSNSEVYSLERVPCSRENLAEPETSYYTQSFVT